MARTVFFSMVFRKFSEITKNKPIFSQYNIFYNYEYFFFQSAFWSLFNHRQRSQSNQEQCSLCCSSPCFLVLLCTHYGPLKCFSTYFRKLKEVRVLRLTDNVVSCDYVLHNSQIKDHEGYLITFVAFCTFITAYQKLLIHFMELVSFCNLSKYDNVPPVFNLQMFSGFIVRVAWNVLIESWISLVDNTNWTLDLKSW